MSYQIGDELLGEGMSSCCSAAVIDPSGEGVEGLCADCYEHCSVEYGEDEE